MCMLTSINISPIKVPKVVKVAVSSFQAFEKGIRRKKNVDKVQMDNMQMYNIYVYKKK